MNRLEEELRNALRREAPPAGFANRVVARATARKSRWNVAGLWSDWFGARGTRWAAATALALVLMGAGFEYQQHRAEQARGEQARAQVLLALRIAGTKLQFAEAKVQQLEGPTDHADKRERVQ